MSHEFDPTNPDDIVKRALPNGPSFSFWRGFGSIFDIMGSIFQPPKPMTSKEAFEHDEAKIRQDIENTLGKDLLKGDE